jgi:hypothetical protein
MPPADDPSAALDQARRSGDASPRPFYAKGRPAPVLLSPVSPLPARVNDFFRCRRWLCSRSSRSMAIAMPAQRLLC